MRGFSAEFLSLVSLVIENRLCLMFYPPSEEGQRERAICKYHAIERKRPLVSPVLDEIMNSLLVDMVYNTNRIEGSTLSRDETEQIINALIKNEDVKMSILHGMEVVSWISAWKYARSLISLPTTALRLKHIKKIHQLLMIDNYGFRCNPKDQVVLYRTKVLLARPEEVAPLMEALMNWLHEEVYGIDFYHIHMNAKTFLLSCRSR